MIFAEHKLALRHERAAMAIEAAFAEAHRGSHPDQDIEVRAIADGAAVFAGVGSPMSQATGLGMEGGVSEAEMVLLEAFYHDRGASARLVVCPLADPTVLFAAGARGFALNEFEQVMVRDIQTICTVPSSSRIIVAIATEDQMGDYVDAVGPCFTPDGFVSPEMRSMMMTIGRTPNAMVFLAAIDGQTVGGGALLIHEGVAMLAGAATRPEHRNQGVHEALFQARLAHARGVGCDLAVMGASPGSGSQRNAERKGFQVAYTKAILCKEPEPRPRSR